MPPAPDPLVLASRSPRRAALLRDAGIPFLLGPAPDVDESPPVESGGALRAPADVVLVLARRKASAAQMIDLRRPLLTADTLVFLDGRPLGKPRDAVQAAAMLRVLSGRWHEVWTGLALVGPGDEGQTSARAVRTRVRFRPLAAPEIDAYVATGEPLDKAGAYGIQGGAAGFVSELEGPLDNVIGLPIAALRDLLGS